MNSLFVWMILALCPFVFCMSSSLMFFWVILEMSSIMFIYTMLSESDLKRKEVLLTYFLMQSIASSIFLISVFYYSPFSKMINSENLFNTLLLIIFIMGFKIALAPLHFWVVKMTKALTWNNIFILLSWQKIIPMLILMKMPLMSLVSMLAASTLLIGVMSQLKISSIKLIILFSSMAHLGWMIFPMGTINMLPIFYMTFYTIILLGIILKLNWENFKTLCNQLNSISFILMITMVLSLSGIPPLLGFLLKWISLKVMIHSVTMALMFCFLACINFYIYMRMILKTSLMSKSQIFVSTSLKFPSLNFMLNFFLPMLIILMF